MASPRSRGVALVTGAAQGLGQAIARRLHADGFTLAVNDVTETDALSALADECGALTAVGDVSDPATVTTLVERIAAELGDLTALVANHAAMVMGPFLDQDETTWWRQVEVNLSGTFRLVQAVVPGMRRLGGGRIVIIASEAGVVGMRNATGYSASKGGLVALTKSLGRELAPEGIITNAIAPSYIDTPQLRVDARDAGLSLEEMHRRYESIIPLGRLAQPAEIAAVASFLLGRYAEAFVGQIVQPNGGTTRSRG